MSDQPQQPPFAFGQKVLIEAEQVAVHCLREFNVVRMRVADDARAEFRDHEVFVPLETVHAVDVYHPTVEDARMLHDAIDLAADVLRENTIAGEEAETKQRIAELEALSRRILGPLYEEPEQAA
jgi:hypothetical protein